ncbi:cell wall hydrolase [Novosphingobium flavum]|uniref:Cell wall hydrolase n=1 Tax=Novosphingobium flavum TaxID=1778672 RepID=A0A7X1FST6_9SPHN|nr:cell wall hydrolase [Novosphingobium flavum]MBC2666308.1 cell wall hydrolase [Novosphingobium flavum]
MSASSPPVLDLAKLDGKAAPLRRRHRQDLYLVSAAVILIGAAIGGWNAFTTRKSPAAPQAVRVDIAQLHRVATLNVDDRSQIVAEGSSAQDGNARIPFAAGAAVPMVSFRLSAPGNTALRCLTQAIYYEAATEPLAGRRAVAQVVLNRVRHPAYPKSVCGVVYQGAELSTGCQFSFTCDGSLLRQPMVRPWNEAEEIARAALAGHVEPEVGTATHYHADYVLPRWAYEMDKIAQLGRHLFYRFEGNWGRPGFFSGQYNGREAIPALDFSRLRARLLAAGAEEPVAEETVPGLTVAPHVTDRHAENDVGGRIDTTRAWRLTIPDPTEASSRYRAAIGSEAAGTAENKTEVAP